MWPTRPHEIRVAFIHKYNKDDRSLYRERVLKMDVQIVPGREALDELLDELPPGLLTEVQEFVEFLLHKKAKRKQRRLRLSWAGGLKEYRDQYTSLELQKKALEWWGD